MGHTTANHGAEGRIVEPSFWIIGSFIDFGFGRGQVTWWWGGATWTWWGGLCGGAWFVFFVLFECFVITVGGVVGWRASSRGAACLLGWEGTPIVGSVWKWCGRVEETVDQLTPILFV